MSKENKVLLVLGASSDIGQRLVLEVHDRYDTVLCHYHANDAFLEALRENGAANVKGYQADFADAESTARFVQSIRSDGYAPDHIVHLPAVPAVPSRFAQAGWDVYERQLQVSLRSVVAVLRGFIPGMAKQRYGKVLFLLTSYIEGRPPKYLAPYVTAKYALLGLLRSLAAEYAERGIRVNGVSPEMVDTKFLRDLPAHIVAGNAARSPLGRNLTVEEVTPALRFLLSDAADGITGENIVITGGK